MNIYGLEVTSEFAGERPASWDKSTKSQDRHYIIKCTCENREIQFDFYPSVVNPRVETERELKEALQCFVNDARAGELSLDDFVDEFGYSAHNIKISEIISAHDACEKSYHDLKYLVGQSNVEQFIRDVEEEI